MYRPLGPQPWRSPMALNRKAKICPFLWYAKEAEEAARFYTSIFPDSKIDKVWTLQGGQPEQCGWLRDKFGVSWQIVPAIFDELMGDKDPVRAKRVADAMLQMV